MPSKSDAANAHTAVETCQAQRLKHVGNRKSAMSKNRVAPHPVLERYYHTEDQRLNFISSAFDETAVLYDRINTWMSFGSDRWYRRKALLRAGLRPGMRMADVGCGTGLVSEIAAGIVGPEGQIFSVDPSAGMLKVAVSRGRVVRPLQGQAENLPLEDNVADFLCMGFALRHVADLDATFSEYRRVLKPGGRLLVMELTPPRRGVARALLKIHMRHLTPFVTGLLTGSRTAKVLYEYCWDTFDRCVPPERVLASMANAGLTNPVRHVSAHIFSEYTAGKPD